MPRIGNKPDRNNIGDVPCWRYAARRTRIRAKTVEPLVSLFKKQLIGIDSKYRRRLFLVPTNYIEPIERRASYPPFRNAWKNGSLLEGSWDHRFRHPFLLQPEEKVSSETVVAPRNRTSSSIFYRVVTPRCCPLLSSRVVYSRTRNNIDETGMGGGRRGRGSDDSIRGRGSACIKNNNVTRHRRSWPGLMGLNQPLFFSTAPPVPIVLHRTRPRAINSRLLLGRAWVPPNNKDNEPIGE